MRPAVVQRHGGHRGPVYALAEWKGRLLSGGSDGTVASWSPGGPEPGEALAHAQRAVFAIAVLPGQDVLLIGTMDGDLHVVDLKDRREAQRLTAHRIGIYRIIGLPGDRVACAGGDGVLSVWGLGRKGARPFLTLERRIPMGEEKLRDLAVRRNGSSLAVACGDGTVRVLEGPDLNERLTLEAHEGGSSSVAWHPGKPVLVSGGKDGHLRTWRADDGAPVLAQAAHRAGIYALAFSPAGTLLASASRDKTAKLWDADDLRPVARLDRASGGHANSVNHLCWAGGLLITAGDDRQVIAWSAPGRAKAGG